MPDHNPAKAALRAVLRHLRLAFIYAGAMAWSSQEASLVLRTAHEDAARTADPADAPGAAGRERTPARETVPAVPPSAPDPSTPYAELAQAERRLFLELDELIRQEDGR
ncbi:hypothetical protein [Actinomadura rupiterrae]|uniref:hypothetical protein n=1 Tax=Actinomadura rupiterrae TaxID=559627 RepID=UPI0020A3BE51|nr:hypothetical protein [Actinomadura rupiterrae]MCP2341074.1 hypothetical protein [Actinomadura rupiterrae]